MKKIGSGMRILILAEDTAPGFHLTGADEKRMNAVISGLSSMGISELRPGHCTGEHAVERMEGKLGAKLITAGYLMIL